MKGKNDRRKPPLSFSMVEDRPAEWLKKRLKDLGLIVNAGAGSPAARDFTHWEHHDSHREAFDRLLRDLAAGA